MLDCKINGFNGVLKISVIVLFILSFNITYSQTNASENLFNTVDSIDSIFMALSS